MYDPVKDSFTHFQHDVKASNGLRDNWVNAIFEDGEGNIWVSTSGSGINIYNKKTRGFSYLTEKSKDFQAVNVGHMMEDRQKNFWISTTTGLYFFDRKTNKFSVFTIEHGLPSNIIHGVLEDNSGYMWVSTTQGVSRFNPQTKKFKNYTAADGLQSNE